MPSRRRCTFNSNLQGLYPCIRQSGNKTSFVKCKLCGSEFSISNGGKSDIENHLKSKKHTAAAKSAVESQKVDSHFRNQTFGSEEKRLAAHEGLFAYHTVYHGHSFRSMDCTSKLIKELYNQKFTCGRTKCEAIIENVFCPFALDNLGRDLKECSFVTVYYDGSNHKDIKLVPMLIRYFLPQKGVQVKILQFSDVPGETSDILYNYIKNELASANLTAKVVAVCADNTNTNFGGQKRNGVNNVHTHLKKNINNSIIGIGCAAHIIYNAIKTAADCLPLDLETIVIKIYSYFYIYTVRVTSLKEFCEFCEQEYKSILGYSKTRFLALRAALERLLRMFEPLKSFFLSTEKCPRVIEKFLTDPCAEIWLFFLHNQAELFNSAVLQVEGEKTTIIQVAACLRDLKEKLANRIKGRYVPLVMKSMISKVQKDGECSLETVTDAAVEFYQTCLEYLDGWTAEFEPYHKLNWMELNSVLPDWQVIENSVIELNSTIKNFGKEVDTDKLFDEIHTAGKFLTSEQLEKWKKENGGLSGGEKWELVFKNIISTIPLPNL